MKIVKKHETPDPGRRRARRRAGPGRPDSSWRCSPPPPSARPLVGAGTGGVLGAVAGHAAAGMSRDDLKELGEQLDAGEAGLIVVGVERQRGQDRARP